MAQNALLKIPPASNDTYLDSPQPPDIFAVFLLSIRNAPVNSVSLWIFGIYTEMKSRTATAFLEQLPTLCKFPYKKTPRSIWFAIIHYTEH